MNKLRYLFNEDTSIICVNIMIVDSDNIPIMCLCEKFYGCNTGCKK